MDTYILVVNNKIDLQACWNYCMKHNIINISTYEYYDALCFEFYGQQSDCDALSKILGQL